MAARIRVREPGGSVQTVIGIRVRDENNVLRTITRVRMRNTSNVLKTVFGSAFTVAISPSPATAYGSSGATANLTTGSVIASASGGTAPYTYAWTEVGTSAYSWTIDSPSAASTTFTAASVPPGNVASAVFLCTITDANGAVGTAQVGATANNGQPYSPPDPFNHCPTLDTLILLANDNHTGPGEAIPVCDLKLGDMVWTRPEGAGAFGAYPVEAVEYAHAQPVCAVPGYPEVTPRHRFTVPFGRFLPRALRWFRAGWLARPYRTATVAKISVSGAHTYLIRHPKPGSRWRQSHNIKAAGDL